MATFKGGWLFNAKSRAFSTSQGICVWSTATRLIYEHTPQFTLAHVSRATLTEYARFCNCEGGAPVHA